MLALTSAQVQIGDLCLITSTTDKGTYVLTGNDPSQFANWTLLATPDAPVTSVNTKTGTVVLTASDVGALGASASIPISQITGLSSQLATFATSTALTTGLNGKASPTDVQNMFFNSSMVKKADYVANASVSSLAGTQSVDGVLVPNNAVVLLTSQSSSVNNGLWVVNSGGSWTRPADFAPGNFVSRDTIVIVNNSTGSSAGVANPNTIWQMSVTSGFVDSSATNWTRIGWVAPPFTAAAGNGITITGGTTFATNLATTIPNTTDPTHPLPGGLTTSSGAIAVDAASVPRKFITTLNVNSTVMTVNHRLNTTSPTVGIWDNASGTLSLSGITITDANNISIEFGTASGTYRVVVIG